MLQSVATVVIVAEICRQSLHRRRVDVASCPRSASDSPAGTAPPAQGLCVSVVASACVAYTLAPCSLVGGTDLPLQPLRPRDALRRADSKQTPQTLHN